MRRALFLLLTLALASSCGGGSTSPDAAEPDDVAASTDAPVVVDAAEPLDAARVSDGVLCSGVTGACAVGEVCCESESGISCEAPASGCLLELACDGPEDCPEGGPQQCCSDGAGTSCTPCAGRTVICHDDGDCLVSETCCPIGGAIPMGALMHCTTLGMGEACPAPP